MTNHSKFSPSASSRWLNCPASFFYHKQGPPNKAMADGTLIHSLAEDLLSDLEFGKRTYERLSVNQIQQAYDYREYVQEIHKSDNSLKMFIETRVGTGQIFGTVDTLLISPEVIHVIDLKTGRSDVSPVQNEQLMIYTALACDDFKIAPSEIHIHIFQPLAGGGKVWTTSHSEVFEFMGRVRQVIEFIQKNPEKAKKQLTPGPKQCLYCMHKFDCSAVKSQHQSLTVTPAPNSLPNDQLYEYYIKAQVVKDICSKIEDEVLSRMQSGQAVGDLKLVQKRTHRAWKSKQDAEDYCTTVFGDKAFKRSLKSPAQVEKLLKASVNEEYLKESGFYDLITKPDLLSVADAKDSRPAIEQKPKNPFQHLIKEK